MASKLRLLWLTAALALLLSCSSVPENIRKAPADSPMLSTVRASPDSFKSREVRWGGEILETANREDFTELTVLARPLSKEGEPSRTDASPGRFIVRIAAFIDPEEYTAGRRITVRGALAGAETRKVGEYSYVHPVVQATDWYLWPVYERRSSDYYPWWYYDPWWYSPWYHYPYYYYPSHHPHHHRK